MDSNQVAEPAEVYWWTMWNDVIFMMHSISCVAKYIQNSVNNLHYKVGNAKMNLVKIFWKVPIWIRPAYVRWQAGEFRDTSCKEILKCDSKFSRPLALKSNPFLIRKSTNSICRLSIWSLFSSSFFVLNTLSHTLLNLLVWYHVTLHFLCSPSHVCQIYHHMKVQMFWDCWNWGSTRRW